MFLFFFSKRNIFCHALKYSRCCSGKLPFRGEDSAIWSIYMKEHHHWRSSRELLSLFSPNQYCQGHVCFAQIQPTLVRIVCALQSSERYIGCVFGWSGQVRLIGSHLASMVLTSKLGRFSTIKLHTWDLREIVQIMKGNFLKQSHGGISTLSAFEATAVVELWWLGSWRQRAPPRRSSPWAVFWFWDLDHVSLCEICRFCIVRKSFLRQFSDQRRLACGTNVRMTHREFKFRCWYSPILYFQTNVHWLIVSESSRPEKGSKFMIGGVSVQFFMFQYFLIIMLCDVYPSPPFCGWWIWSFKWVSYFSTYFESLQRSVMGIFRPR